MNTSIYMHKIIIVKTEIRDDRTFFDNDFDLNVFILFSSCMIFVHIFFSIYRVQACIDNNKAHKIFVGIDNVIWWQKNVRIPSLLDPPRLTHSLLFRQLAGRLSHLNLFLASSAMELFRILYHCQTCTTILLTVANLGMNLFQFAVTQSACKEEECLSRSGIFGILSIILVVQYIIFEPNCFLPIKVTQHITLTLLLMKKVKS